MLLRSLKAVNFREFREVDVPDLPRRGVVAVEGSSPEDRDVVRSMLLFAFFGRAGDPSALIRSGAGSKGWSGKSGASTSARGSLPPQAR